MKFVCALVGLIMMCISFSYDYEGVIGFVGTMLLLISAWRIIIKRPESTRDKIKRLAKEGKVLFASNETPDLLISKTEATKVWKNPKFTEISMACNEKAVIFRWGAKSIGFGEVTFYKDGDNWVVDTEHMSNEFVLKILGHFLKSCTNVLEN